MVCLTAIQAEGQTFTLEHKSDSLSLLVLESAGGRDVWKLPYPTYAFATGDVDGDGIEDALVGVVKPTRYDPRMARRLFVFRNVSGRVRPLWLGSRLAGELHDFRLDGQRVVTLEQHPDNTWFVGLYRWDSFGFVMTERLISHTARDEAERVYKRDANRRQE